MVDAAFLDEVGGVAVVGGEGEAARVLRRDGGEQRVQVAGGGGLADEDAHPQAHFRARFVRRHALVVGGGAGGDVGLQPRPAHAGRVPVDVSIAEGENLLQRAGQTEHRAGHVHEFRQTQDARQVAQRQQIVGVQRCARRAHVRRGNARGQVDEDGERQAL